MTFDFFEPRYQPKSCKIVEVVVSAKVHRDVRKCQGFLSHGRDNPEERLLSSMAVQRTQSSARQTHHQVKSLAL